tara:strand:+ start:69 stop:656 length:588 start_codon:yes stop_codon:yes gene_type:complete
MSTSNIQDKIVFQYIKILMEDGNDFSLKTISKKAKVKLDDATLLFPFDEEINKLNYMKIFLKILDQNVLNLFFKEIKNENITFYEKLLEGIILRFEELLKYKKAIKKISINTNNKILNLNLLFFDNHIFMIKLLKLSGDKDRFIKLNLKAIMLNSLFLKILFNFLNEENNDMDSLIRNIDNDLKILFDFKILFNN